MSPLRLVVAIDGPGGSGKSTVARAVAAALELEHLDTGAMYRAVTFEAARRGIAPDDEVALASLANGLELIVSERVLADGNDITEEIRGEDVNSQVSHIASKAQVREALVRRQRDWVLERGAGVVEGRDIGSVVLPDADVKVYLTAAETERARRRAVESGTGISGEPFAEARASIVARDSMDSTRAVSPLVVAEGAVLIDSTDRSAASVIAEILELARAATEGKAEDEPSDELSEDTATEDKTL
jgi:CMP/dCMP kinase